MKIACKKDPTCKKGTWEDVWSWVKEETRDLNDGRLAHVQAGQRTADIRKKQGASSYIAAATDIPDSFKKEFDKLKQVYAALQKQQREQRTQQPRGRTPPGRARTPPGRARSSSPRRMGPDARWNEGACWECGRKGHPRKQCPKFLKVLSDNNGKLPPNHKGAYQLAMEKKAQYPTHVHSVTSVTKPDASSEDEEDPQDLTQAPGRVPQWGCTAIVEPIARKKNIRRLRIPARRRG